MRINALTCIDTVLDSLDKMIILDEVLPFLMDVTLGQDAKIVMAVVGMIPYIEKFNTTSVYTALVFCSKPSIYVQ